MIKKLFSIIGAVAVLQTVHAQFTFPVYEPFSEYPEGERLRTAGSSGNYWNFGNTESSSSSPIISSTNALSYPGLQADPGNPPRGIWGASAAGRTAGAQFTTQNSGTVYLSFLFEPVTLPTADRPIMGLNGNTSGTPSPNSGPSVWISPTGQLKIAIGNSSAPLTNTTPPLTLGSTYLIVMSYTFTGNLEQLWVSPTSLGNNGSIPAPVISSTNATVIPTQVAQVDLYSGSGIAPSFNVFDEIRVDTSWAGVTPASPSPGTVYNVTGGGSGCPGDAFAVGLSGSDSSSIQYLLYTNGTYSGQSIAGASSAISFGPQSVTGTYSVLASNTVNGNVGWMNGTVNVSVLAGPVITSQPASVVVANNGYATFSVAATGSGLSYHWYKNTTQLSDTGDYSGTATPTLTVYPAQSGDAATTANGYYVVITNSCGLSATSSPKAALTLDSPANLTWAGANPNNDWDLATTLNFTSLGNPAVFNAGDNVTFDDSTGNTSVILVGNLAPTTITENSGQSYFFSGTGAIVGPSALVMNGSGSLTISNVNTYTGGTTVHSGNLIVRSSSQQSLGSGTVTLTGGTLEFGAASGAATVGLSNNINTTASSTLQFDGTGTYGLNLLGGLSGSSGATLTIYNNVGTLGVAPDRLRLYGTFTNNSPIFVSSGGTMVEFAPYNATGTQVYNGVISGSQGHILPRGAGTVIFNGENTINDSSEAGNTTGPTGYGMILSGSIVGIGADSISSSPPTIDSSPVGSANLGIDVSLGNDTLFANGGAHTIANPVVYLSATNNVIVAVSGSNNLTLSGPIMLAGADGTGGVNRTFMITNTALTTFSGVISDAGQTCGLVKGGSGTLVLSGANTYTGSTLVTNGTLLVNGQVAGVTTLSGGVLGGTGSIQGSVSTTSGTSLNPGAPTSIGTLTLNANLRLGGNALFKLNKSLSPSSDSVTVLGTLSNTGTGTVTVTNMGPALAVGDKFTLFSQPVASGSTLTVAGAGVTWTNKLAVDGSISVVSTNTAPVTGAPIALSVNAGNLSITWPGTYLGWELEVQTNSLSTGLKSNAWSVVPGSTAVTNESFTISRTNASVFYRLAQP